MGIIKILFIILAAAFLTGLVKGLLAKRKTNDRIAKKNQEFISEELYKLHELYKRGILSEDEYRRQKTKLLNRQ